MKKLLTIWLFWLSFSLAAVRIPGPGGKGAGGAPASNLHLRIDTCTADCTWDALADGTFSSATSQTANAIDFFGIAAGGGGSTALGGGGGGASSRCNDVSVTPATGYAVAVGTSAANTNGGDTTFNTTTCVAKGGLSGANGSTGGAAASGTGSVKFSGGNGRNFTGSSGGGGGAGDQANGATTTGSAGGSGGLLFGGKGGPSANERARGLGGGGGSGAAAQFKGAPGVARVLYFIDPGTGYPVVLARAGGQSVTDTTSHTITLPTHDVGDLLLVIFSEDGSDTLTATAGWTILGQVSDGANSQRLGVLYKVADGSDALTVTSGGSQESVHLSLRIVGASGNPTMSTATGDSTNSDPPSHACTGDATPKYYIAVRSGDLSTDEATPSVSAAPSGFYDFLYVSGDGGALNSSASNLAIAGLHSTTDPMNPGTFTSLTEQWSAATICVPGS